MTGAEFGGCGGQQQAGLEPQQLGGAGQGGFEGMGGAVAAGGGDPGEMTARAPCSEPGQFGSCEVVGWADRPYDVYRPSDHDLDRATPVVLLLHGGTGNSRAGINGTCATDVGEVPDRSDPSCLHQVAEREGFVLVAPNGTEFTSPGQEGKRGWNAGGGIEDWQCVGGEPCLKNVDDIAYVTRVLDELEAWMTVDRGAVFATGLSNGAAMAHRLACELSERIVAIAPVGGANQFAAASPQGACSPERPVAVLQIHGADDPCWTYTQSSVTCGPNQTAVPSGVKVGVPASMLGWSMRYGCDAPGAFVAEADTDADGIFTQRRVATGCQTAVELLRIEGAGHTNPNGNQYLPVHHIGDTSRDWGMERIWGFFDGHRRD